MTSVVKQDVLRLEIPIDDVESMKVLECTEELCRIESTPVLVKLAFSLEVIEEFSTVD